MDAILSLTLMMTAPVLTLSSGDPTFCDGIRNKVERTPIHELLASNAVITKSTGCAINALRKRAFGEKHDLKYSGRLATILYNKNLVNLKCKYDESGWAAIKKENNMGTVSKIWKKPEDLKDRNTAHSKKILDPQLKEIFNEGKNYQYSGPLKGYMSCPALNGADKNYENFIQLMWENATEYACDIQVCTADEKVWLICLIRAAKNKAEAAFGEVAFKRLFDNKEEEFENPKECEGYTVPANKLISEANNGDSTSESESKDSTAKTGSKTSLALILTAVLLAQH